MTNTQIAIPADRRLGSILGLAYGDAIGDPVEFRKYKEISKHGVDVPMRMRVTDDTQMSLAVWDAIEAWGSGSLGMLRLELAATFGAWLHDPDNNRAPGATCMSALTRLEQDGLGSWTLATSPESAGCGSVMRAPWIGLSDKLSDEMVGRVGMLQAVLTHGPAENAFCAAALAELTRAIARDEVVPGQAADWLVAWVDNHDGVYDTQALSDVWRHTVTSDSKAKHVSPVTYVAEGLAHVRWVARTADELTDTLREDPWGFDPAVISGEGWRAREAVAMAVGVFDAHGSAGVYSPLEALLRAAETSGDSDSTAAITGALVGAHGGEVFPKHWMLRLEVRYQHELARAAGLL